MPGCVISWINAQLLVEFSNIELIIAPCFLLGGDDKVLDKGRYAIHLATLGKGSDEEFESMVKLLNAE